MEVVNYSAGGKHQWVFFIGHFVWHTVIRRFNESFSMGVNGFVLFLCNRSTGVQVVAIGLAVFQFGIERPIGVNMPGAVGMLFVAGPLDAAAAGEFFVAQARI